MRRKLIIGLVPALTVLAALAAGVVQASGSDVARAHPSRASGLGPQGTISPVTDPLNSGTGTPNGSLTLPASAGYCPFDVTIAVVTNHEYQEVFKFSNGQTVIEIKGRLVLSFTNDSKPAKTLVADSSGANMITLNPDGSGTQTATGNNWWGFGTVSQGNIGDGQPGLVLSHGPATIAFAGGYATGYALFGSQENLCKRLAR